MLAKSQARTEAWNKAFEQAQSEFAKNSTTEGLTASLIIDNPVELLGPQPGKESQKKYGEAFNQARQEFAEMGTESPTGTTPGFRERVQDIYKSLMGESYKPVYSIKVEPAIDLSINNSEIKKRADEIYNSGIFTDYEKESFPKHLKKIEETEKETSQKPIQGKTYGGYSFSLAQMETVQGLSDERRITIGKTMVKALAAHKKKYQIK